MSIFQLAFVVVAVYVEGDVVEARLSLEVVESMRKSILEGELCPYNTHISTMAKYAQIPSCLLFLMCLSLPQMRESILVYSS